MARGARAHLPRAAQFRARLGSRASARLSAYSRTNADSAHAPRQLHRSGDAGSSRRPPEVRTRPFSNHQFIGRYRVYSGSYYCTSGLGGPQIKAQHLLAVPPIEVS